MKNKYVLDTSFISSLYKSSDVNHIKAIEIFKEIEIESEIIIPINVLLELISFNKRYELSHEDLMLYGYTLASSIEVNDEKYIFEINKFQRQYDINLKAMDMSILFCAWKYNSQLLTFDNKLLKVFNQIPH